MHETESIFNPIDDSLAERVRAYQSVSQAYLHIQASVKEVERNGGSDYLGDKQEVLKALTIAQESLKQANQKVSRSDLQDARQQGLLSETELVDIVRVQREQEMTEKRSTITRDSDELNLKR